MRHLVKLTIILTLLVPHMAQAGSPDSLSSRPVLAFRSNLLLPLMNVGIEVPVGNRWSLEADWYSPWVFRSWMNTASDYYKTCIQAQALYLGGRLWLGRYCGGESKPRCRLLGHSIGISVAGEHYDIGHDYKGEQGDALAVGMDYMYAMPLGRKGKVHLEFTAGVGAQWSKYSRYKVAPGSTVYDTDGITPVSTMLLSDGESSQRVHPVPFRLGVHLVIPIFTKEREDSGNE